MHRAVVTAIAILIPVSAQANPACTMSTLYKLTRTGSGVYDFKVETYTKYAEPAERCAAMKNRVMSRPIRYLEDSALEIDCRPCVFGRKSLQEFSRQARARRQSWIENLNREIAKHRREKRLD